jgi:hypothetical protein
VVVVVCSVSGMAVILTRIAPVRKTSDNGNRRETRCSQRNPLRAAE